MKAVQAECAAALAAKEEEVVDLLQERARDRASIAEKELLTQEQARAAAPALLPPLRDSLKAHCHAAGLIS